MKKFVGAICSAVAGLVAIIMLSLNWCTLKMGSFKQSYTGWELIEDEFKSFKELDGYVMYKIFAIVLFVVAIILLVSALLMLLKSLNVLKLNINLSFINNILLSVLVLAVILALVGLLIMSKDDMLEGIKCFAAVGAWVTLVVSIVACGAGWALARKDQ